MGGARLSPEERAHVGRARRVQGPERAAVPRVVSAFADVLEAALNAEPEPSRAGAFEGAVRAFEAAVAESPTASDVAPPRPSWATTLGVQVPCTVEDVRRAFRRLAFETHPDRPNGSQEGFLRACEALEGALAALRALGPTLPGARRYTSAWTAPPSGSASSSFA